MIYTNTEKDINRRNGMGSWMKNYSLTENGKDWNYCVGLSYRRREMKTYLKRQLKIVGIEKE